MTTSLVEAQHVEAQLVEAGRVDSPLTVEQAGRVGRMHLADGVLVQLSGTLSGDLLPDLREALLSPFAETCLDVVVDAGAVDDATDAALAILVAAGQWTLEHDRRFAFSRTSAAFDARLDELGLLDGLPRLESLTRRARQPRLPQQRAADD